MSAVIETSSGENMRVWTKDPYAAQKKYRKKRLAADPEYRKKENELIKESMRRRYAEDEEYRNRCKDADKKRHQAKKNTASTKFQDAAEEISC